MNKKEFDKIINTIEKIECYISGKSRLNGGYANVKEVYQLYKKNDAFIVFYEIELGDYFDCDNPKKEIYSDCRITLDANTFKQLDQKEINKRDLNHEDIEEEFLLMENINPHKTKSEPNYKKAYFILMDYWDSLPDEEKEHIDKKLKEVGL